MNDLVSAFFLFLGLVFVFLNAVVMVLRFEDFERALSKSVWLKNHLFGAKLGLRFKVIICNQIVLMLIMEKRSIRKKMIEREVMEAFPKDLKRTLVRWWFLSNIFTFLAVVFGARLWISRS